MTDPFAVSGGIPGAHGLALLWLATSDSRTPLPPWVSLSEWGALLIVVSIGLFWSHREGRNMYWSAGANEFLRPDVAQGATC